jgi:hypothetical protein
MKLRSIILAGFLFVALPLAPSFSQVGISVNFAPPPLPVEVQPPVPVAGYIWTPGYWAWGGSDYYLVPGAWAPPPTVGLLWTPPWWGWNHGVYAFNEGYWGPTVGFYGGINYGYGYSGSGYWGGRWEGDHFNYNTAVTHVNTTVVHNTYVDKSVVNKQVNASHASFNGPKGAKGEPTAEQKAAAENAKKMSPTSEQLARQNAAKEDPKLQAKNNHGKPNNEAIKSFNQSQHGEGATGVATAGGAGAGKGEKTGGNVGAEHHTQAAGGSDEWRKSTSDANVSAEHHERNVTGGEGKMHTNKGTEHAGVAHGQQHAMMAHHQQMGAQHHPQQMGPRAQGGGNRPRPSGGQQQGKKKPDKP